MTQPKIQQWQADVVGGGGPVQYFGSFYRETDLTIPVSSSYTTLSINQVYYDVGPSSTSWVYDSSQFAAPAGLTYMRIQAGAKVKTTDGSAIPTAARIILVITNPSNPSDTIANFSIRGSGIPTTNPSVGSYLDSIYLTTGWRSTASGGPFSVKIQHNHTSTLLLDRAWITMEGV